MPASSSAAGRRSSSARAATDLLEKVAAELRAGGGSAIAVACDVTKDGDPEAAVARAVAEWGRLDTVLANAGFAVAGRLEALTLDDYRRQLETNVFGTIRTLKAALPELKKSRGRIGVVGSVNGFIGTPATSAYCASKFAVRGLCDSIRPELKAARDLGDAHRPRLRRERDPREGQPRGRPQEREGPGPRLARRLRPSRPRTRS